MNIVISMLTFGMLCGNRKSCVIYTGVGFQAIKKVRNSWSGTETKTQFREGQLHAVKGGEGGGAM